MAGAVSANQREKVLIVVNGQTAISVMPVSTCFTQSLNVDSKEISRCLK